MLLEFDFLASKYIISLHPLRAFLFLRGFNALPSLWAVPFFHREEGVNSFHSPCDAKKPDKPDKRKIFSFQLPTHAQSENVQLLAAALSELSNDLHNQRTSAPFQRFAYRCYPTRLGRLLGNAASHFSRPRPLGVGILRVLHEGRVENTGEDQ